MDKWSKELPETDWMWATFKDDGHWWCPTLENVGNFKKSLPYRPRLERMYIGIDLPELPRNE